MDRDDSVFVKHILDTARKVADSVRGMSRDEFDADENFRDATAHRVQIVGEAASHLSPEFRQAHPEIAWHRVIGMRHRIVHDYMNVDYDVLWQVATRNLDELIPVLAPLVASSHE